MVIDECGLMYEVLTDVLQVVDKIMKTIYIRTTSSYNTLQLVYTRIQYPGWLKDTTGKELWSGENDEVSKENRDVWGNIKWGVPEKVSMPKAVSYSHWWLWCWVD